jgi:Tol biopolymer transport system component
MKTLLAGLLVATSLGAQAPAGGPPTPPRPLPLVTTRKAEFTTTQGTWMSLDVSPDGKTIVFDLVGDIYTVPISGGKATRLTSGQAFDAQPRFSPDGKKIVFVSDKSGGDNVYTMTLDLHDTTQVTQGNTSLYMSPEWTPDGSYVVVSRSGGLGGIAKLQMYHAENHQPMQPIRSAPAMKMLGAAWSPDGRYLWYSGQSGDWNYNALFPQAQLYRYDRESGLSTLMTNRYGSAFRPAVSPDGTWLVYGSRNDAKTGLRMRNLTTGEEDWLAFPVQRDDIESRAPLDILPGYSFMPDSKAIVISYGGEIWRVPMDKTAATKIPFTADVKLDIGPEVKFTYRVDTSTNVTARQIRNPATSPDGKSVAFTAFDRLWVKEMPNGTARRLTSAEIGEYHAAWSPDGRTIAFVTWDDSGGGQIMKVPAAGGPAVVLTRVSALYYNLAWSPDGRRIVATRAAARDLKETYGGFITSLGATFVWVSVDGGDVNMISPSGTRDVMHFRMDQPDRIYAYSPVEGLVSFRWDGTDVRSHVRVIGPPLPTATTPLDVDMPRVLPRRVFPLVLDSTEAGAAEVGGVNFADLILAAPRGDFALAQIGNDIYTVTVPKLGGPVPAISVAAPGNGPVPTRKLTDIGGEFASWNADGTKVHWAIGNAFATYDITRAKFMEDSTRLAVRARVDSATQRRTVNDSLKAWRARSDSLTKAKAAIPDSVKKHINELRADSVKFGADSLVSRIRGDSVEAAKRKAVADSIRAGLLDSLARPDTSRAYKPEEKRIFVTMPRDIPRGTVVLRGGRAVTMKGKEIIENADVLVKDNRIVAIGARGQVTVPADAQVIDVSGKTLMPGFVDTHYHTQWLTPEIHPRQTWQYLATLAYGVTTTRDPQTATTDVLSYGDRVEVGGMVGPRINSTGPGVFLQENIRNLEHAKTVLKRYSQYYDTKTLKMYMTGNRQQREWIVMAAKELELMPTTEGGLDFKLELTHAMDGYSGVEHALPITPIYSDIVQVFKASQTTNTPTLLVSYGGPFGENWFYTHEHAYNDAKLKHFTPEDLLDQKARRRGPGSGGSPGQAGWFVEEDYVFTEHAKFVKAMIEGGARTAVGSHGQLQGLGYLWELFALGTGGLANHDVLRTATIYGAEAIGLATDIGSLEPGKMADIIVFDKDPLENLRNATSLKYVMKNGRLYEAESLNEIWPRQRMLPVQVWQNTSPGAVRAGIR